MEFEFNFERDKHCLLFLLSVIKKCTFRFILVTVLMYVLRKLHIHA